MADLFLDFDGPITSLFDDSSGHLATIAICRELGKYCGKDYSKNIIEYGSKFISFWEFARSKINPSKITKYSFDQIIHLILEEFEIKLVSQMEITNTSKTILSLAHMNWRKVAIVSNNSVRSIELFLKKAQCAKFVDQIVGRNHLSPFENLKPSTANLRTAIKSLGSDIDNSVFIGDTFSDYKCSNELNMRFIGIQSNHSYLSSLTQEQISHWIFKSTEELVEYLRQPMHGHLYVQ